MLEHLRGEPAVPRLAGPSRSENGRTVRLLTWMDKIYGLKYCCLRYFNAAGAHPDGHIGEAHDPETHLIPLAIRAAAGLGPRTTVEDRDNIPLALVGWVAGCTVIWTSLFTVGSLECFAQRLCEPCAHLERLTPGTLRALIHKGGLRADILSDGEIRVGDEISAR